MMSEADADDMTSDDQLEEMLHQAALLEAQMKSSVSQRGRSSQEGSVQTSTTSGERESGSRSSDAVSPPMSMLQQAELLSRKMRSSRQQAFASAVGADDSDVSVDDMLRKAELLSLKMKSPVSSPPRGRNKSMTPGALEGTPGLIRQSERILSTMLHDQRPSNTEMTTPELMRQTEHLLAKMKASPQVSGSRGSNGGETSSFASDVLSNPDSLIAKMKADKQAVSREKPVSVQRREGGGSEELKRLMEEALTSWTGSNEEKGRVKDALEQIVPNLESTPQTPSTVSIQQTETDEISSVGSLSPRTRKSNLKVASLLDSTGRPPLSPTESYDVDAAEELVRNMAIALREARFGNVGRDATPSTPPMRPAEESGSHDEQPTPPSRPSHTKKRAGPPLPSVPSLTKTPTSTKSRSTALDAKTTQSRTSRANSRNVRPPPPPTETPPKEPRSSVSFTPTPTLPMSSEEAQYNAIMQAINSSGTGRAVSWERVESAGADDDDYVPLADYSNKGGARSLGVGTFDIPGIGRSPRVRRRRRKIGKTLLACLVVGAVGVALKAWLSGGFFQNTVPSVVTDKVVYFEEPVYEPIVKHVTEEPMSQDYPISDESNAIVLRGPKAPSKLKRRMVAVAQGTRKLFLHFVISLTPPWERFCEKGETCRDTSYLLNSIAGPA